MKQKFREIAQLGKMRKTNLYIPLTEDTPPSPFEVRPPWLRNRNAYLTWGLIGTARSNLSSAMSPTQSSEV